MNTDRLRIELTKEQQDEIEEASGHEIRALELNVEELEQRVAPEVFYKIDLQNAMISHYQV